MKKTSFTLAGCLSEGCQKLSSNNMLSSVLLLAFMLFGNLAFAQMPVCGNGNVVNDCPGTSPTPVNADPATCQVPLPDFRSAGPDGDPGTADDVPVTGTAAAGYTYVGTAQEPFQGTMVGTGVTTVEVFAVFVEQATMNLCAEVCADISFTVNDVTPPVNNCMGAFLTSADDDCVIELTEAYLLANMFNAPPSDNCTAAGDLTITASVASVGPLVCPGPNPQNFPFVITVTDEAGNSTPCNASIDLLDDSDPTADFDPAFMGGAGFAFEVPMTNGCGGDIPNIIAAASNIMDNCTDLADLTITQFPPAGSNAVGVVAPDPVTGCLVMTQDVTIRIEDCFTNFVEQAYIVTYRDEIPAQFINPLQVCALAMNDLDYVALGGAPLVADGSCMVIIPDLSDEAPILGNVNDNCNTPSINQDPPPGPYDVSGICPPNNTIDVTFTPVDCDGNEGTPVTCDDMLSFTDNTPPMVVCPADPITVVIPFDDTDCTIGMAMVDLPLLLAEGVTVTDNCDNDPQLVDVTPNMFTCSDMGKAGLTVSITAEDCFGNQNVPPTECAVEVVADDDHVADWSIGGGDFFVCPDEFPVSIVLGADTPGCGVWSGDVAVTGAAPGPYTLEAGDFPDNDGDGNPDPGSYSITYTVGPLGCHIEQTHNIQISPEFDNGDAALTPDFSICWEATETFDLNGLLASATVSGAIDGGQEVPPSGSAGTGSISGALNPSTGALEVTIDFSGLTGNVVAAHIHEAPAGANGPVIFDLVAMIGFPTGGTSGTATGTIMLSPAQVATAQAGDFYVNIHTDAVPSGEIRGQVAVSGGAVSGGAFSIVLGGAATGTLNGSLFQYNGGDGTLTVTYTLEDCDADTETDEVVITIDEKPDGHFTMAADMCQDEGVETPNITGVPAGASVSFASSPVGFITNATTGEFDPASGPLAAEFVDVTVTMTVTNGVCADYTVSQVVRVYESGDPAFTIPATICESAAPLDLMLDNPLNDGGVNPVTDDNVTWTGTSVGDLGATGTFDPSVGPGVYTICVTVGAPSCEEEQCHDITVEPDYTDDDVALIDNFDLCGDPDESLIEFAGLLDVTALPGGVFTVVETGTLVGTVNPNSYQYEEGCGTLEITYSFPDDCDVPTEDVVIITIEQKPEVGGVNVSSPLCATDDPVLIDYSGTPEICGTLGVFSGPGVTDGGTGDFAEFDPAAAGEGQHDLFYDLNSPTGICNDVNLIFEVQVDAASPTDFTVPSEVCSGQVVDLMLDNPDPSVLPGSPDGNTEIEWFGGDGVNAIVTDNGDGTGTFVGTVNGTYTVCVRTGDTNCSQYECQQITVDIIAPVMNCDPLVRTRDNDAGECSYTGVGTEFDVTATDNCDPAPVLTHDYAPYVGTNANSLDGAEFPVGITQVIWTATDNAGNSSNCTIQIEIEDAEDPTVQSCPTSFSQGTDADICGAEITYVIPQFADNCDGLDLEGVLVSGYAPGTDFPVGTTTVTWEYTDLADNMTATCTFEVTVNDDDNPTPICSPAYAVSLDGDGEFDVLATDIDNASYDNCQIVSTLISRDGNPYAGSVTMTCDDVLNSPITVTLQVVDAAGNASTCTTDVTVNDDQVPDIECPGDYTVVADPVACSAVVTYPAPTVTDNCTFTVTQIDGTGLTSGDAFPVGTTVQTYQAEDIAGNIETCTFTILVIDEVAPTVDCGPTVRTRSADPGVCSFTMPGTGFDAVGDDNCPGVTITHNYPFAVDPNTLAGSAFPVGSTTVTWIATDAFGNQSDICGIEIIVTDDEDPTIDCGNGGPANILMNASFEAGGPFDSFGADDWTHFGEARRLFGPAFNAQDGDVFIKTFGGAAGLFQDFPAAPGDELFGSAYLQNASFDPTGPDQFGLVKFEFLDAGGVEISETEGPQFFAGDLPTDVWTQATVSAIAPPGTVTARFVVVSVTLSGGGAIMMDAANVNFGPGGVSGNVSVSADAGECGAELNINNPDADDNCGIVSIINDFNYTQNASGFYPVGTTVVGFTATDASGNTADCVITVEVTDDEAPEFVNCPTTMVMVGNDVDECAGKLNWSIPVATDNCELASITQTAGPASGTSVPVGTAMDVTYTATDIYGNSSECTFTVQVVDTQEPSFDADVVMPADITVECDAVPDNCVFHGSGTPCEPLDNDDVMDNCTAPGDLVITFDEVSTQGADPNNCDFYNYTLTRTWTVTDEAGNQLVHVQVITVEDTTPPVPACQDATITLDKFGMASINPVDLIAGTTDNCAPFSALDVVASQTDFDCTDLGPNSVTLTISDPCGNSATCTITVTVEEGPAPCTPGAEVATSCLNNSTNLVNGQFEELITVTSLAMENWTVTGSTGLYTSTSAAPPAAPTAVANGSALTMGTADGIDNDGDGQVDEADEMIYYTLLARFVEGVGYSANVSNGTTTISISNIAYYPTPVFTNLPDEVCFGTTPFVPELEDQYAGAGAFTVIEILVDGVPVTQIDPASLGYGQHQVTVTVDANGFTPSTYIDGVNVAGTAATNAESRLDPGCIQSVSQFFLVVSTPTQVVCNDLVHVTLEQDCESTVTPDMVLEGTYPCFDDYSVLITTPAGVPLSPPDVVTGAHAGMELPYSLVHPISGNLCWGHILVEDKTNPEALCPGDVDILCTVDPDSIVNWLPFNHPCYPATDYWGNQVPVNGQLLYLGQPDAIDCSSWTWEYTDDYTAYDCSGNPALIAEIIRTFVVTDEFGNQGTCTQTINKVRGEVDQIDWPADLTFACNDPILSTIATDFAPSVLDNLFDWECGGNTQGWPEIWEENLTTAGTGVCGLGITYSDELVNICPNSYKVVRTWKVHDWCPASGGAPTVTEHVQYIKVENVAPVITVECDFYEPGTGYCILNATEPGIGQHGDCYAIYVPFAQVDAVCDEIVEVTVETQAGFTINGGYIPAPGLPIGGPYDIVYRAEDQCGNISEYVLTVVVEDKTAPTAVCDEITDVNLTSNGQAVVFAETFDDGSDDNCALQDMLVRRMTDNCGVPGNTSFGPSVTFCCEDVDASPIMVVFRAVDYNGNWNECMVEVNVQDKIFPIAVSCPPNQRVTCDWYADNLETQLANAADDEEQCDILDTYFGVAQFYDNCNPIIQCNVNINVDQCLEGVVTRNYTVSDPSDNTITNQCNQIINVDHVSDWVVEFPADLTVECGTTVPEFGEPEIFFETCELVAVSYEDEVFTVVTDACYKILRTWTVINWCVVGDEIDEEFEEDPENQLGLPFPQCDLDGDGDCDNRTFRDSWANGTYPGATDATTTTGPDTDFDSDPWDGYITYQQTIKVNDTVDPVFTNGCNIPNVCIEDNTCVAAITLPQPEIDECSVEITFDVSSDLGSGFGPFFNVAPGTYDVTYTVTDNCNNQSSCETTITVEDCKKPTPYCKNGIIVELMNTTPPMIEVWASDLDAGSFDNCPGDLLLSFSSNTNDIGVTYDCDNVGQNEVELWVTDAAGNQDYCETFIIVQDNMNACDDGPAVAGLIATEEDEAVANVDVQLSGTNQMSFMTDTDGMYNFDVAEGGDYTVTPVKDDEPLNGVTTFDLVLITQHILGTTPLNSPYKMIAADANNSQSITTFDVLTLRKLILFIDLEFQNNTSWRFVDKDYSFPEPTDPWAEIFPEVVSYNDISANELSTDFVAVKVGDVNNSASLVAGATGDRNANGTLVFNVDDIKLTEGQTYQVDFTAKDFAVMGYQFTLNYDQKALDFVKVVDAVAGAENFGLSLLEEGAITASWNKQNVKLADGEVVFSLVFDAKAPVQLSNVLSVNSRYTKSEAYQQNGDLLDVALTFNGQEVAGFELYQNTPNPFSSTTKIGFNLPEASAATLTITDISGKVVKTISGDYAKGYNEISLERRELPAVGILYYQLDSNNDSDTRMMLLVD